MPPLRFPPEPVLDDPQIAPPYCDLLVQEIVTKPDHEYKRLNACAVIANRGQAPPSGPILVTTTVIADICRPQYGCDSQETTTEWRWYVAGTSLPFRTLWMSAALHYVEDGGGQYLVLVQVGDAENLVGDRNLNNNLNYIYCPPFYKPATFHEEMNEPLRHETTMKNGKFTSTLTIGGKPLKGSPARKR